MPKQSTWGDFPFVTKSGLGNVTGPASATNNHLAVFDGPTGKKIKDGGALPAPIASETYTPVWRDGGDVPFIPLNGPNDQVYIRQGNVMTIFVDADIVIPVSSAPNAATLEMLLPAGITPVVPNTTHKLIVIGESRYLNANTWQPLEIAIYSTFAFVTFFCSYRVDGLTGAVIGKDSNINFFPVDPEIIHLSGTISSFRSPEFLCSRR